APYSFTSISVADAQMLSQDLLPVVVRGSIDTTPVTEGITVYGKPGTSVADLDHIADQINQQVPEVKAIRPSDLVRSYRSGGATFTAITTAAAVLALVIGGLAVVNTMIMAGIGRYREIGREKGEGAATAAGVREG